MALEIRSITDTELADYGRLREQGYGFSPPHGARSADLVRASGLTDRVLGAFDRGAMVATLAVSPFGQFFGGRPVPMGGVGSVVVLPEYRNQGIASALLRSAIDAMRSRGEVISALGPATIGVYRQAGWELAGDHCWRKISTVALSKLGPSVAKERRAVGADHDAMKRVYVRFAMSRPGMLARPAYLWGQRLELEAGMYAYVATRNDAVVGYVIYTQRRAAAGYTLTLNDFAALDWDAELCLWAHLGAHRAQASTVITDGLQLDSLAMFLSEGSIASVHDHQWMLRIVNAPLAVAARGFNFGVNASIGIRITDPIVAANGGCWDLTIADGRGQLETATSATIDITINGFASLYSGLYSARTLAANGTLAGATPEQLTMLDAALSGPRPTMTDDF